MLQLLLQLLLLLLEPELEDWNDEPDHDPSLPDEELDDQADDDDPSDDDGPSDDEDEADQELLLPSAVTSTVYNISNFGQIHL